jgi:hypothetical protein
MVRRYNSGKTNTTTTTTTTVSIASTANQAKLRPNTPHTNNSTSANTGGNSFGNNTGCEGHPGNSGLNRRDMFCNYCRMSGSHLQAMCHSKQNNIRDSKYKAGGNVRQNGGSNNNNKKGANRGRWGARGGVNKGRAFTAQNQEEGQDSEDGTRWTRLTFMKCGPK